MKRFLQVFRDGHGKLTKLESPLAEGVQGNMQTLEAMARLVREQRCESDLRNFVLREIIGGVRGHNFAGEVEAIFRFTQSEIVYRRDPFGIERVADIWSTLYALNPNRPEGDCGIKSTFFASCCALVGHKPFFVIVKQRPGQETFNHVYNAVLIDGAIRYFDATPEDRPAGWEVPSVEKLICNIFA